MLDDGPQEWNIVWPTKRGDVSYEKIGMERSHSVFLNDNNIEDLQNNMFKYRSITH